MTPITTIKELFEHDIDRDIPSVVVVSNREALAAEVQEYVVTPDIRKAFHALIQTFIAMQDAPTQAIGVWVSGFFGSGKSSFAKTFGYILANPDIPERQGEDAPLRPLRDVLLRRFGNDPQTAALFTRLSTLTRPTEVIIFDLSQVLTANDVIMSPVVYRMLLRHFRYSTKFQVAELELQLERDGRMDEFRAKYRELYTRDWNGGGTRAISDASAVMHHLEPATFNEPDSWMRAQSLEHAQVTPQLLADRALEMATRRGNGANVVFIVDEVGQFVSRSIDRMLDLQGILHAFDSGGSADLPEDSGVTEGSGRGRLWFVATAQEQLGAVMENLDDVRSELGRLMDRFQQPIDLKPQDIATVTTERLLKKTPQAAQQLRALYAANAGTLKLRTTPESSTSSRGEEQRQDVHQQDVEEFVNLYPLLHYQFGLIIEVIAKIRQSGQVASTFGASVRPVLSMSQMLLKDSSLGIGTGDVGNLVRFDQVYDQLNNEGKVPSEDRDAINELAGKMREHGSAGDEAMRVAKALVLVGYTRESTFRTSKTLAALTYPGVDAPAQDARVAAALQLLVAERFVSEIEGNYRFLSKEGRTWEEERAQFDPGARARARYREELARVVTAAGAYSYQNLRTFRPTLWLNGNRVPGTTQGDIDLRIEVNGGAAEAFRNSQLFPEAVVGSVVMSTEAQNAVQNVLRSEEMIRRHGQDANYATQTLAERRRLSQQEGLLERAAQEAVLKGQYFVNGDELQLPVPLPLARLTETLLQGVVPRQYKYIGRVTITPKNSDIENLLTLPSLASSQALLGTRGLGILHTENGQQLIRPQMPVLQDITAYLKRHQEDGMAVSGRDLEAHFDLAPYGYTTERLRYLLAVLLRAGQLDVKSAGRTISSWNDDGAAAALTNLTTFRQAQFAVRRGVLTEEELIELSQRLTDLTGHRVMEFEEAKLGQRIREGLSPLLSQATSVLQRLEAAALPVDPLLTNAQGALQNVVTADTNVRVVHAYQQSSQTLRDARDTFRSLDQFLTGDHLIELARARTALSRYAPLLPGLAQTADDLTNLISAPTFFQHHGQVRDGIRLLEQAWQAFYAQPWHERYHAYHDAAQQLQATPEFEAVDDDLAQEQLRTLRGMGGASEPGEENWRRVSPPIDHLRDSAAAASYRLNQARQALLAALPRPVATTIRVERAQFDPSDLDAATVQLDAYLAALRDQVLEPLQRGEKVVLE